ncbi:CGNR zinc finger domain-containing protein [Nocardia panacis]|nr:ABATE domain-containing protein [Nocardia panacis]
MDAEEVRDWVWYGGRVSVDFVNTRRDRYAGGRELLEHPSDLDAWFTTAQLIPCRAEVAEELLREARQLREAIDAGIRSVVGSEPFDAGARDVINNWLARANHPPRLELSDGLPILRMDDAPTDATGALYRIALDAAQLLGSDTRSRIRICAGAECSGRFVDLSVAGRRRWCRMSVCGNRAKAAQHRRSARSQH